MLLVPTEPQQDHDAKLDIPKPLGMTAITTVHETVELVAETADAAKPAPASRGKWHEKFGKSR
jgi:hypothetical protein